MPFNVGNAAKHDLSLPVFQSLKSNYVISFLLKV